MKKNKNEKIESVKKYLCFGLCILLLLTMIVKNDQGTTQAASKGYDLGSECESVSASSENQDLESEKTDILIESLQRDGGIDIGGLILAAEPVVYHIQVKEYDNSGSGSATASDNESKEDENGSVSATVSDNESEEDENGSVSATVSDGESKEDENGSVSATVSDNESNEYENASGEVTVSGNEIPPSGDLIEVLESRTDGELGVLKYKIGDIEETLPIQDGYAQLIIEEDTSALLKIWYEVEGEVYPIIEEYLMIDQTKPEIICERIKKDDKQYAKIVLTDQGEGASGLKDFTFTVDGEACDSYEVNILGTVTWPNGEIVPIQQEIDIPLDEDALPEIEVQVLDNAGNSTTEIFQMGAVSEDIINISLPDSFRIVIRPLEDKENRQIYGEDIVVGNQDDFSVKVTLTRVEVYVNHLMPDSEVNETDSVNASKVENDLQTGDERAKDCEIYLQFRQAGCETVIIPLNEGLNENILDITLAAKQADDSSCAVLNICGNLTDGSEMLWRDGDLKVTLTFKFSKLP